MVEYKKYKTKVIMLDIFKYIYGICMYGGISSVGFDSFEWVI